MQEEEKYRTLKADINNQTIAKLKNIMKEQQEKILGQGRKEGKGNFLQKIASTTGIQGVNAIENMKLLHPMACDFMVHKDYENQSKICLSNM